MEESISEPVSFAPGLRQALAEINGLTFELRDLPEVMAPSPDARIERPLLPPGSEPGPQGSALASSVKRFRELQSAIDISLEGMEPCSSAAPPKGWAKWFDSVTGRW